MAAEQFGRTLSVLVIDDDSSLAEFVGRVLDYSGFTVEVAVSKAAGEERLRTRKFDLILVDQVLPDGSGLDIAHQVLDDDTNDTEVIVMSAYASINSTVEAIRVHAADFLIKPLDRDILTSRVKRAVAVQDFKRHNRILVDELRTKNEMLQSLVERDGLTGLFNHAHFQQALQAEIARSARHKLECSLIFFDVDLFKHVNDTFGHPVGDNVLKGVARALDNTAQLPGIGHILRSHDVAIRYGGDEFALILPETARAGAVVVAERLREYVASNTFDDRVPALSLSVGVASYPEDARTPDDLLRAADSALYGAKAGGRNRVVVYGPHLAAAGVRAGAGDSEAALRVSELERSINERAFNFQYQPIVAAKTWEVLGYEALCRPTSRTFPTPAEMFATAERAGMIRRLGRVLRDLAVAPLPRLGAGGCLFINIHPYELNDPELLEDGGSALGRFASQIVLEVTGLVGVRDYTQFAIALAKLRKLGFRIALDDLGAGYSGLDALAQLEPDFVKVGSESLRGIETDTRKSRLIKHVLEFSIGEGVKVIADGIETAEDEHAFSEMGCSLLQGFHIAAPGQPFVRVQRPAGR